MRLKKVRIIVEDVTVTSRRWANAIKGKVGAVRRGQGETITVPSWDVLGRVMSPPRLELLTAIHRLKPKSIAALAKAMKKDFKNVHSDIKFLADLGLIELKQVGARSTLVPTARFSEIDVPLAAA